MLVVADSSPFVALLNISCLDLLPSLFGQVTIPALVAQELALARRPPAVRELMAQLPAWLVVRSPSTVDPIPLLHAGEVEAISLARELRADLLLIDDKNGRKAATERGLAITGTIGVLEMGATRKLIDLEVAFQRLKQTDFRINHAFLDARLHWHRQRRQT